MKKAAVVSRRRRMAITAVSVPTPVERVDVRLGLGSRYRSGLIAGALWGLASNA